MILVTGASGVIGAALVDALVARGISVRAAFRRAPAKQSGADIALIGNLGPDTAWTRALTGVNAVAHLAGPAHAGYTQAALHSAIVGGGGALAAQAAAAGVKRFVFVSSIKAAAARTHEGPALESDAPAPEDGYGRAKLTAERMVLAYEGLGAIAVRPPLVIAPNARGNFARLLQLAASPLPLPFSGIANRRSLVSLPSLIEALMAILVSPLAQAGIFHVADAPALSTGEIVAALREGMGRSPLLFQVPALHTIAPRALTESLEVDASKFTAAYGWRGGDARAALVACAAAWRSAR